MKISHTVSAVMVLGFASLHAAQSQAGGIFGDGGLDRGGLKTVIDGANIVKPVPVDPAIRSDDKFEKIIDPLAPAMTPSAKQYQVLEQAKTPDQRTYEDQAGKAIGVPVSNICFTVSQACTVTYTTTGSSCFCTTQHGVDLGIVK